MNVGALSLMLLTNYILRTLPYTFSSVEDRGLWERRLLPLTMFATIFQACVKYLLILFKNSPWSQTHPIEHAKYLLQPGAPFPRFAVLDIALPTSF